MKLPRNTKRFYFAICALVLLLAVIVTVLVLRALHKPKTYEEKVVAFAAGNEHLEKGQIVFIGDSITERYRLAPYRALDLKAYNRGISGDTTDWMLSRLQTSLFDLAPAKIVLMIGTNDINGGKGAAEIALNYEKILSLISANLPDAAVYCVSVIPQNTVYAADAPANNQRIREANREIAKLATGYGYVYVNLYDSLLDADGLLNTAYSVDGLHLGRRGYRVYTDVMKPYLQE